MILNEQAGQPTAAELKPAFGISNIGSDALPSISDDETRGYAPTSLWYKNDDLPFRLWLCTDATEFGPVWMEIPLVSTGLAYTNVNTFPTGKITGRSTAGTGALEALTVGSGLSLSAGTLSATGAITIGSSSISSGTNNRVLYQASGVAQQSANLTFDGTTLTVGSVGRLQSPNSSTIFLGVNPHASYSGTENIILGVVGAGGAIQGGTLNVCIGSRSGDAISSGVGNLTIGYRAGYGVTTGSYNTAFGYQCLGGNATACIAFGTSAMGTGTGSNNVAIGDRAGIGLTNGYYNTLVGGDYAGGVVSSGIGNSFFGTFAGQNLTTGSYNVAVGYNAQLDSATGSNQTNINDTFLATSTQARIGGRDFKIEDAKNIVFDTTTGTKIGTATSQKLAFWNKTPIVQPTTGITGATRVGGGGATLTDSDTFGGYTVAQIAAALINSGILA